MRYLKIVFLCLFLLGLTGCQREEQEALAEPEAVPTETEAQEEGLRIAVVVKATDNGYWKNMEQCIQNAVDAVNSEREPEGKDVVTFTYEGPGDEADVTGQINIIDAVLAENPSVLCLSALDEDSCEAQLETARENGIPVIMFDSDVSSKLAGTYCGTDNRKAGRKAADKLARALGRTGQVAVFSHEKITETSKDRVKGFRRGLRRYPGMELVSVVYDQIPEKDQEEEISMEDRMRMTLDLHPNLSGIFCTSEKMAETALDVLEDYPDRQIALVGFDAGKAQKKAIAEGREYGCIVQDAGSMAEAAVRAAVAAAEGSEVAEERIYIPFVWVDADNLSAPKKQRFLYD